MKFFKSLIDDNYIYSNKNMGFLNDTLYLNRKYSYLKGFIRFVYSFYRSWTHGSLGIFFIKRNVGMALVGSKNNYQTVTPLISEIKLNVISFLSQYEKATVFPLFYVYLLSIVTFPITIILFICSSSYGRMGFKYSLNEYILIPPLRIFYWCLFKIVRPSFLIIVNDHIFYYRAAVKVAKSLEIKTFYIQHASVTEKFPPLFTDIAFLDGEDSKAKYLAGGKVTNSKIYLTGSSKYDELWDIRTEINDITKIGIATNEFDDLDVVKTVIFGLRDSYNLVLRAHPSDIRYEHWWKLAIDCNIGWSPSRDNGVQIFLLSIDCVIAYNTGILLEAMITGRPSFSFQFSNEKFDHYGFQSKKLVEHFDQVDGLKMAIETDSWGCDFSKCRYYYALYNQYNAGCSSKEIVYIINSSIN